MRQLELELKRFKKGFSLIEVLVAVMILAVVGVALMQINVKNQKISEFIDKKTKLSQISSIIGFHHKTDYKKLQKLKNQFVADDIGIKFQENELNKSKWPARARPGRHLAHPPVLIPFNLWNWIVICF